MGICSVHLISILLHGGEVGILVCIIGARSARARVEYVPKDLPPFRNEALWCIYGHLGLRQFFRIEQKVSVGYFFVIPDDGQVGLFEEGCSGRIES